jgi:uncharacterized protein YacL
MQMILQQQQKTEDDRNAPLKHFHLTISDWFSTIAIVAISYLLLYEYLSTELVTRENVFKIGFLFSLLLFNIIFLAVSMIERRIIYWIDGFITVVEHIFGLIRLNEKKEDLIILHSASTHPRAKKKKRTTRSGKK